MCLNNINFLRRFLNDSYDERAKTHYYYYYYYVSNAPHNLNNNNNMIINIVNYLISNVRARFCVDEKCGK